MPVLAITRPTVIAFFPRVTEAELLRDPDTNEALSDFQHYAAEVREPLRRRGIQFHELYTRGFSLRHGSRLATFRPSKIKVGYYLVSPGKKPRVEYGVMTGMDLLEVADAYFQ